MLGNTIQKTFLRKVLFSFGLFFSLTLSAYAVTTSNSPTQTYPGGAFTVSWSSAGSSCNLWILFNGAIQSGPFAGGGSGSISQSQSTIGQYGYYFSCNDGSPDSVTYHDVVAVPPPPAPTSASIFASPNPVGVGAVDTISWSGNNSPTSYTVVINGSSFAEGSVTSWTGNPSSFPGMSGPGTYSMSVQACNAGGCATGFGSITLVAAPTLASISATPATPTGNTTISWSGNNSPTYYNVTVNTASFPNLTTTSWTGTPASLGMSSPGTYPLTVQACNSAGCSPTSSGTITVTSPPATATLTQSVATTITKGNFTITWGSTYATSCTVSYTGPTTPGTISSGPTSGTATLSPSNTGVYTITNSCSGSGGSGSASVSHTVIAPDLTAGTITPTTGTVGTPLTLSSTISNIGTASTGASFFNFMQFIDGNNVTTDLPAQSMAALAAGASANTTYTFTPSGPGTFQIRACADKSNSADLGTIDEAQNEGNNCGGWVTLTLSCPSGQTWNGTACAATVTADSGTKTIVRGSAASITINMGGTVTSCTASTTYPSTSGDTVRSIWMGSTWTNAQTASFPKVLGNGSNTFPQSFDFSCTAPGYIGNAHLTVTDCTAPAVWNGTSCAVPAVTGVLTMPATCSIPSPNASCPVSISWTTQNATSTVTVERAYSPFGVITGGTGANGSTTASFSPPGSYTLNLKHNGIILDSKTITVTCASNSNWNGSVCQALPPAVTNLTLTGNNTPSGSISFGCSNSSQYSIVRTEGATGIFPVTAAYSGPVTVAVSVAGNYQVTCSTAIQSASQTVAYDPNAALASNLSLTATPRSIEKNAKVTLAWSITNPNTSCRIIVTPVCTGTCAAAQTSEASSLQTAMDSGSTDSNDPYGASRTMTSALQTPYTAGGTVAKGKKTIQVNYTTDFKLQCGTSTASTTIRVLVTKANEG